jgi:N-acetylglucosaminyldiphosphoundecaprenol N-acetyl-beta-D-mannosaminyltransferase
MNRVEFLGCPMDIATMQETVELIGSNISDGKFTQHVVVNVAKIVNSRRDSSLSDSISNCDIINIDGQGVVLGARFLGIDVRERVAGIDLFLKLIQLSAEEDHPVFLLGATQEVVSKTKCILEAEYPKLKIAGIHHGYFWDEEEEVVNLVRNSGAKLLFVAITSPKKENFIEKWQQRLGVDFVMGVGGSFDVIAGKAKRAPLWMQYRGLEWFFRVMQEPRRLWRRYFYTNSVYFGLLVREKVKRLTQKR